MSVFVPKLPKTTTCIESFGRIGFINERTTTSQCIYTLYTTHTHNTKDRLWGYSTSYHVNSWWMNFKKNKWVMNVLGTEWNFVRDEDFGRFCELIVIISSCNNWSKRLVMWSVHQNHNFAVLTTHYKFNNKQTNKQSVEFSLVWTFKFSLLKEKEWESILKLKWKQRVSQLIRPL